MQGSLVPVRVPREVRNGNGEGMSTFIIAIHIIVCVALILIVLLQTGKGADMGAVFGGGSSQTLFGSSGASTFLTKMTTAAAVIFMLTSLSLAYFSGQRTTSSVMPASTPAPAEESGAQAPGQMKDAGAVESKGEGVTGTAGPDAASQGRDMTGSPVPTEKGATSDGRPAGGGDEAGKTG